MNENESKILVPLDPATKAALEMRAKRNDRAMSREASAIIKNEVKVETKETTR